MRLRRLLCRFGFHGARRIDKRYSERAYRIVCVGCGYREVMNDDLRACVPWDASWDGFYARFNDAAKEGWGWTTHATAS